MSPEVPILETPIDRCLATRKWLASIVSDVLRTDCDISEQQFAITLRGHLQNNSNLRPKGWYEPPPDGIAALFSESNNFDRLQFDTLRKEEFWPKSSYRLSNNSAGLIYASPIDKESGIIGDFGLTIYRGANRAVHSHLASCLHTIELAAEYATVGMELKELHNHAQQLFTEHGLHNSRTITWTDTVGTNLGHTIPWSYESPTKAELEIIHGDDFDKLKSLISHKRVHVNHYEAFKIPKDIAFSFEARLESIEDPSMPNVFFHLIISFQNGNKCVSSNFNDVFATVGMDSYINSRFE